MELLTKRTICRLLVPRRTFLTQSFRRPQLVSIRPSPISPNESPNEDLSSPSPPTTVPVTPSPPVPPFDTSSQGSLPSSLPALETEESVEESAIFDARLITRDFGPSVDPTPRFARGQEEFLLKLNKDLHELLQPRGQWHLTKDGCFLRRTFVFKTASEARVAVDYVLEESNKLGHHPALFTSYTLVSIRWTTHRHPKTNDHGLTGLDIKGARMCNELSCFYDDNYNPPHKSDEESRAVDDLGEEEKSESDKEKFAKFDEVFYQSQMRV